MLIYRKIIVSILFTLWFTSVYAQQTASYTDVNKLYREAMELYHKEKFVAAQQKFQSVQQYFNDHSIITDQNRLSLVRIDAEFYSAVCALELFNDNAESLLINFVNSYPEHPNTKKANFEIGKFYYRQRNFTNAISYFKQTEAADLDNTSRSEFYFKYGYSLFEKQEYTEALEKFKKIKSKESKYTYPSIYYSAFIYFEQKNYKLSLESFNKLKDSKVYAEIVPYYIIRINYELGNYTEVVNYSAKIADLKIKNEAEVLAMIASSEFKLDHYEKASAYFAQLNTKYPSAMNPQVIYEYGYSDYKGEKYTSAISTLTKIAEGNSSTTQNALYLMADAFLKTNDKHAARNAFWKASRLTFDPVITANSLFNYAKLSYELQFNQTAIESLQEFIKQNKKSEDLAEAKSLLAEALLSTKNYKEAIRILEQIEPRTKNADLAYQKVTYFHGIELLNAKDYKKAIEHFNKSLGIPVDKSFQNSAWYWKGEAYYLLNNYDESIKNLGLFIQATSTKDPELEILANYSIAYSYFKKEDYKSSIFYFDKYIKADLRKETEQRRITDATLRLADGYFVIKDYDKALFNYNKIINEKLAGTDYALFQKGMILGLQNKQNDKIVTLKNLLSSYPKSSYVDDAYYETGNSYFMMNNIQEAIQNFSALISNHPNSRYVPKAKLSLGLIYYNESQDEKALAAYKSIIKDYPGSEEAKEALLAIKNIYVDAGNADDYLAYVKTLSFASVSSGAQDSISFQAANNRYLVGDCENAINSYNSYISKFENGFFITEAHANRAECLLKNKQDEKALIDLNYLITNNRTKYLERSLLLAARINFRQKNYKDAAGNYIRLEQVAEFKENYGEAISGAMRSYMLLNDTTETVKYANKILAYEKASTDDINQARLFLGKTYYAAGNKEAAWNEFSIVVKNTRSETGAEAKYYTALILFEKGEYLNAQQACFDLSNQVPSYEYWVAKAFILLADTYNKLGNDFQARSTLQSVIDEYSGNDDIIPTAKKKLESLSVPK